MKIAFDAKRIFNNQTGLGNYSRTLLDNLYHFFPEYEYCLYTPKLGKASFSQQYAKQFKTITANTTFKNIWRSYAIRKDLEKDAVDLYHGLSNEIPFWLKNTKTIVTIHDVIFKLLPHTYPQLDRWMYEEKTRYACQYATQIIAISETTKKDLVRFYDVPEEKIQVVYQPCQPTFYEPIQSLTTTENLEYLPSEYLLYVGSINERKNLLTLVKAIRQLSHNQRIPLVIVGQGKAYKKKVQAYIASHKLEKWMYWLDDLTSVNELKALYQNAQLFIYPSFYEGFGLPVVEAMLCETPVITTNVSALPEAGGNTVKYIHPNRIFELSEAIETILQDSELQRQMGKKGRKDALSRFDPKKLTSQVVDIYKSILGTN